MCTLTAEEVQILKDRYDRVIWDKICVELQGGNVSRIQQRLRGKKNRSQDAEEIEQNLMLKLHVRALLCTLFRDINENGRVIEFPPAPGVCNMDRACNWLLNRYLPYVSKDLYKKKRIQITLKDICQIREIDEKIKTEKEKTGIEQCEYLHKGLRGTLKHQKTKKGEIKKGKYWFYPDSPSSIDGVRMGPQGEEIQGSDDLPDTNTPEATQSRVGIIVDRICSDPNFWQSFPNPDGSNGFKDFFVLQLHPYLVKGNIKGTNAEQAIIDTYVAVGKAGHNDHVQAINNEHQIAKDRIKKKEQDNGNYDLLEDNFCPLEDSQVERLLGVEARTVDRWRDGYKDERGNWHQGYLNNESKSERRGYLIELLRPLVEKNADEFPAFANELGNNYRE